MTELKRGPSFKDWKIKFLLDVAGTGRTIQTRRPLPTPPTGWHYSGDTMRTQPDGRIGAIAENPPYRTIGMWANYPPGSYYVREGTCREDIPTGSGPGQSSVAITAYTCDGERATQPDHERYYYVPWRNVDGSERKTDKLAGRYMPEVCARVRFDITEAKLERFGNANHADAFEEGVEWHPEWEEKGINADPPGKTFSQFFNEVVIPGIYDGEVPADWWWVYEGTVSLIGECDDE